MSDPVAAYQRAYQELQAATAAAERVVGVVTDAARKLGRWQDVEVTYPDGGYPPHLTEGARQNKINPQHWPSAEALHKTLLGWHKARAALQAAWDLVPPDRRAGLIPPSA